MSKHMVFGSEGLLGRSLVTELGKVGEEVCTLGRKGNDFYFDLNGIMDDYLERKMIAFSPDYVHLASYAAGVDWSERNHLSSFRINVTGITNIIFAAKEVGAKVIFPSSSYVFAGGMLNPYSEEDITSPINVYGRHKEILENRIRALLPEQHIIYRLVGLFGYEGKKGKNFVYQVINNLKNDTSMRVPNDQTMNPLFAGHVAEGVLGLIGNNFIGTIHMGGDKDLSKYEWARRIAKKVSPDKVDLIQPVSTRELNQIARRPLNGRLKSLKYEYIMRKRLKMGLDTFLDIL